MIDTDRINRDFDLVALVERHTELKHSGKYHIGPCPFCGGRDRFQLRTEGDTTKWYCRGCGQDRYHDAIDYVCRYNGVDFRGAVDLMTGGRTEDFRTDPERLSEIERKRQERAERESAERARRLSEFSDRWISEEYHSRMADKNYRWWERQGIPRSGANFWRLGYVPEKRYHYDGQLLTSPAYVIPKYDFGWNLRNVDYRLTDPAEGAGKYRPEHGLPASLFLSRPDLDKFPDEVILVEGSKKAMVTTVNSSERDNPPMVIGVPGKSSWCGVADRLKDTGRVWVIMDPDARKEARRLARMIGEAARIVTLPVKIDDGFTRYGLTWGGLRRAMRHGVAA